MDTTPNPQNPAFSGDSDLGCGCDIWEHEGIPVKQKAFVMWLFNQLVSAGPDLSLYFSKQEGLLTIIDTYSDISHQLSANPETEISYTLMESTAIPFNQIMFSHYYNLYYI